MAHSKADIKREGYLGSVEAKIHHIARSFKDCDYLFANYAQANVELDGINKPTILYVLPAAGRMELYHDMALDKPSVMLWFLCPADFDFHGRDNECRVEAMKRLGVRFIDAVNKSGLFHTVVDIPYQVAYDAFDANLTGVCLTPVLEEKQGVFLCSGEYLRAWSSEQEEQND